MVLPNFEENLQKYAKLLVSKGINVQKGHTIVITIDVEQAPFARLLTKEAYALGAEEVIVKWTDDFVTRETYLHTSEERMTNIPQYKVDESLDMIEKKASRLSVRSADPDALNGVDGKKLAAVQKANNVAFDAQRTATQANKVSWTVAAAAGAKWAAKVFPDLATEEEQVDALWNEIFKTCRVYEADPVAAWDAHEARLLSKADVLNAEQFDTLHYTAPNGTDLTIGMPQNHVWESAGSVNAQNEKFIANMPTEEVFSAPDFRRIDGVVKSTKPLSYAGNIIDGMTFRFENGQVTEVTAEKGEETIRRLGRRKRRRTQPRRSRLGSGSVSDFPIRHRLLQHPVRRKCLQPLGAGLRLRIECCWRHGNDARRAGCSRPEPFDYARGLHDRVR